jgi:hypothetical protein
MTEPSPDLAARAPTAVPAVGRRALVISAAWVATLLLSKLPLVIARDLLGGDVPWTAAAWVGAAALLIAATYLWSTFRPLRLYFSIMGLILLLGNVFDPLIRQTPFWTGLAAGRPH